MFLLLLITYYVQKFPIFSYFRTNQIMYKPNYNLTSAFSNLSVPFEKFYDMAKRYQLCLQFEVIIILCRSH